MIKRFNEEQFNERVIYLWESFHDRPEMMNMSFDEFKKQCLDEFKKQNNLTDEELEQYRKKSYNELINEVDKLSTEEEKQKFKDESKKIISDLDLQNSSHKR